MYDTYHSGESDHFEDFEEYIRYCLNEFLVATGFVREQTEEDFKKQIDNYQDDMYNEYTCLKPKKEDWKN